MAAAGNTGRRQPTIGGNPFTTSGIPVPGPGAGRKSNAVRNMGRRIATQ